MISMILQGTLGFVLQGIVLVQDTLGYPYPCFGQKKGIVVLLFFILFLFYPPSLNSDVKRKGAKKGKTVWWCNTKLIYFVDQNRRVSCSLVKIRVKRFHQFVDTPLTRLIGPEKLVQNCQIRDKDQTPLKRKGVDSPTNTNRQSLSYDQRFGRNR